MCLARIKIVVKLNYNQGYRTYSKSCWFHNSNSHDVNQCTACRKLNDDEKMEHLRDFGDCFLCLEPAYTSRYCGKRSFCDVKMTAYDVCGERYHPFLHSGFTKDTHTIKASTNFFLDRKGVLLMMRNIKSGSRNLAFFDPRSNLTMIIHAAARELCLKGLDVCIT